MCGRSCLNLTVNSRASCDAYAACTLWMKKYGECRRSNYIGHQLIYRQYLKARGNHLVKIAICMADT